MRSQQLAVLIAGTALGLSALAADVGISVSVGEPGFYGRLDIGGYPPPLLVYHEPVIVAPGPMLGPVVYLRVPPGQRKHWATYCGYYGACGQRVYFVRDDWYTREYVPRYHEHHSAYRENRWHDDRREGRRHQDGGPPPWAGGREHHGHGHGRD